MYVDIVISNIFNLNKHFFFFSFLFLYLRTSEGLFVTGDEIWLAVHHRCPNLSCEQTEQL